MLKLRTFQAAFPRFYAATAQAQVLGPPLFSLTLGDEVVEMAVDTLLEGQRAVRDVDAILAVSEAIIADLKTLEAEVAGDESAERTLQFIRFIVCQTPLSTALGFGLSGQAHDWFYLSITPDHDPAKQYNEGYGFWPIARLDEGGVARQASELSSLWLYSLYILARTTTGLGKAAEHFYAVASQLIKRRIARQPDRESNVLAAAALLSWAATVEHPDLPDLAEYMRQVWESGQLPREYATVLGQVFCTPAGDFTGRSQKDWAALLLQDFGDVFREHQRLQLMAVLVQNEPDWAAHRGPILEEIQRLSADIDDQAEQMGAARHYTLESRIEIINPLVHRLIRFGDLESVLDVLFAWYGRPGAARCAGDVLFVCPSYADGTAYLWPGGHWIASNRDLDPLQKAVAQAFGSPRSKDDHEVDFPAGWSEQRAGMPVFAAGADLEAAIETHYCADRLASVIAAKVPLRAILTYPTLGDAAPAVIADRLKRTLANEVSLGAAAAFRPLRRLLIWADDTFMTAFEVECVQIAGERAGFEVTVFARISEDIKADFRTFYETPSSDILWVIGHAKFEAHRVENSGLQFDYDTILSWDEMGRLSVPVGGRRLLVLNVCSGAEVKVTGGVARIGIGPELAGKHQMVVGHQWAVDGGVALAFGALAASELAQGHNPLDAFGTAIKALRSPQTIVDRVRKGLGAVAAIDRLEPDKMGGLLNWGCPVILT